MSAKKKTATTAIRVLGETWRVPRGFGRVYADTAKHDLALALAVKPGEVIGIVIDLLGLVGYTATIEQVANWDLRRRVEAIVYASTEHARASDNPVRRHPRPSWLPERSWQGPEKGEGVFAGPSGTPIVEASP
jgi:hypothetical protein